MHGAMNCRGTGYLLGLTRPHQAGLLWPQKLALTRMQKALQ
jgi:hypothetical protein